jgi:hypothetical protein
MDDFHLKGKSLESIFGDFKDVIALLHGSALEVASSGDLPYLNPADGETS